MTLSQAGRRAAIALLATAAAACLQAGSAGASCISDCQAATYCDSEMTASGECSSLLNACYATECNRTHYGALAYGPESGAWGYAYDRYDAASAEADALNNCRANGDDCQVVVDFWDTCAAVAAGSNGTIEFGLGDSRSIAEAAALRACQMGGGDGCAVEVWSCSKP